MLNLLKNFAVGVLSLSSTFLCADVRDGLYFGFGVGDVIDSYRFQAIGTLTDTERLTVDHVMLNAFAGWGCTTCCNLYFAAEVGTTFPERSIQLEHPGVLDIGFFFVNELCVRDYLTGDILLGFRPCPCYLGYLRGGAAFTYGRIHQFANTQVAAPSFNHTENGAGWRVGAGINRAISCNFAVGLDYVFTGYPKVRFFTPDGAELNFRTYTSYVALSGIVSF